MNEQHSWEEALSRWPESDPLCRLAAQLHLVKQLPRTGWVARGVPMAESVGAHSHGVVVWALWLAQREMARKPEVAIDLGSLLAMAALHDLPEAATGDLMPSQKQALFGSPSEQKAAIRTAEARFWQQMQAKSSQEGEEDGARDPLSATDFVRQWEALWSEYRDGKSNEALLLKRADALDCVMQAMLYRHLYRAPLDVFQRLIPKAAGDDLALADHLKRLWDAA